MDGTDVVFSHTYRLGSLRLRQTLETYRAPEIKVRPIMESQIKLVVDQMRQQVPGNGALRMISLGSDMRFAASQWAPGSEANEIRKLPLEKLRQVTDEVLSLSVDELVQRHHLTYPSAETLGPALLVYAQMAQAFGLNHVLVSNVNLRDGLLNEMATSGAWTDEFCNQIIRSARELGRKYQIDETHANHVAELAKKLFRVLQDEHELSRRYEVLLYIAALLHEVGLYVSGRSHHKHALYLINNSALFGLGKTDILLVALVARYHRRASPKPAHTGYATLGQDQRIAVTKLAAILRVAKSLDESRSQRIQDIQCEHEPGRLVLLIPRVDDLSLEQLALRQRCAMFEEIFGMQLMLRTVRP